jgi:HNH endonuclease
MALKISKHLQDLIRERAKQLCEYCHTNERWQYIPFTVDHVLPLDKGGSSTLDNLALACFHCNRHKSNKTNVVDALTNEEIPLFNPRVEKWREHFSWSEDFLSIVPLTDTGRVTVSLLDLNRERLKLIRYEDSLVGRHPPVEDMKE